MTGSVLIVEDEAALRRNLGRFFSSIGCEVSDAPNVRAAEQRLAAREFDVALVDMRLPDGDGLDVVRRVQQGSPATGVLVMTAYASVDSVVEAFRLGAHDCLLKPFRLEEIEQKVSNFLRCRHLVRENSAL
jgi:DNA-binding NtrC family response regulator